MSSNIVEIRSEQDDFYSDDDLYNIKSWGADLSFRELITMYDDDELVKPELQRKYVWDKNEASRFIDSILLGLPVPSIFLAKTPDVKMLIIDGYQRIMTVHDYVKGTFSDSKEIFKLVNSEKINERWRGKAFIELNDADKRKIRNTTIHAIIFEQSHPKDDDTSLYQIFERINTSGRTLNAQEIRNCIYQGPMNDMLIELNKNQAWRTLFGSKKEDPRMTDIEYILRFLALSSKIVKHSNKNKISLKKFLNQFMGSKENNSTDIIKNFGDRFIGMAEMVLKLFGNNAFHNYSFEKNSYTPRFHPTIFDAIAISTDYALTAKGTLRINNEENKLALLKNEDFKKYISKETMRVDHINGRIVLAAKIIFGTTYE